MEEKRPISPENCLIRAVAVAIFLPDGRIYTVEETTSRPEYGKIAGMRTVPMETLGGGETEEEGVKRILFGGDELAKGSIKVLEFQRVGLYLVGKIAQITLFRAECELLSSDELSALDDVVAPLWLKPKDLLKFWVRQGVREMIKDVINNNWNIFRETKPVLLEPK